MHIIFWHILIYCHKLTLSGIHFYEPALCASVFVLSSGKQTLPCEALKHVLLGRVLEQAVWYDSPLSQQHQQTHYKPKEMHFKETSVYCWLLVVKASF